MTAFYIVLSILVACLAVGCLFLLSSVVAERLGQNPRLRRCYLRLLAMILIVHCSLGIGMVVVGKEPFEALARLLVPLAAIWAIWRSTRIDKQKPD